MIITRTNPGHVPGGAGWKTYTSSGDAFTIDFPGDPVVADIPWRSE
jgi:hypothetical protein